jgi:hypothetical protein
MIDIISENIIIILNLKKSFLKKNKYIEITKNAKRLVLPYAKIKIIALNK